MEWGLWISLFSDEETYPPVCIKAGRSDSWTGKTEQDSVLRYTFSGEEQEESATTKWFENVLGWAGVIAFKLCQAWSRWRWSWGTGGEMEVCHCIGAIGG